MTLNTAEVLSSPEPLEYQQYDYDGLSELIAKPAITQQEARDGIISCFVNIRSKHLERGARLLEMDKSQADIQRYAFALARRTMRKLDIDYTKPTGQQLRQLYEEMNILWHFNDLDMDLQQGHHYVCSVLSSKAPVQ